ncbi:MAG: replication-associated recombination protein A [Pirellulaceae bacterium]|nr:replication-associated recombination protein A [Pirellulaceae bacterium]
MDLFAQQVEDNCRRHMPLAARMRPRTLGQFVGQQHFLGEGKLLRRLIDSRRLGSILLYGPPGTGKTTLAHLLAAETGGTLKQLSAVSSGVKELREILEWARDQVASGAPRPLLFVDEIHRFNRAQQDALLPDVEQGSVSLIGATTSNPFFAVNGALLSRSQIFQFQPLSPTEVLTVLQRALSDAVDGLGDISTQCDAAVLMHLAQATDGDARRALSVLEVAILSCKQRPVVLTHQLIDESMQQKTLQYDATGDEHYDVSSALIKSIRGSDPDAALYWLARMLESGEDIRFICRRLVILASEDIGNADPAALSLAVAAFQACELVGLPECQLTLSQAVIYLSLAEKSNSATSAIGQARQRVREGSTIAVPRHLRDAHYQGAASLGHGTDYQYAHDSPDGVVQQDYLGVEATFYHPTPRGWEGQMHQRLQQIRQRLQGTDES